MSERRRAVSRCRLCWHSGGALAKACSKASSPMSRSVGYRILNNSRASAAQQASTTLSSPYPLTKRSTTAYKSATHSAEVASALWNLPKLRANRAKVQQQLKKVSAFSYAVANGQSPEETWQGRLKSGSLMIASSSGVESGKNALPLATLLSSCSLKQVRREASAVGSKSGFNA